MGFFRNYLYFFDCLLFFYFLICGEFLFWNFKVVDLWENMYRKVDFKIEIDEIFGK